MKRKASMILGAVMAGMLSIRAAGAVMAEDDVLTIEFFQQKGEEGPQKGYQALIDKFNEENPDVRIEMNTVPDAPTVLTSRVASGDIPVIFSDFPTQQQFKQKVANGYVQDLSDKEFLKNADESSLEMTRQPDGKNYALPYTRNYMAVFYNMDLFEENGLSVPTTWDEFVAVCETLKEAGITPMGLNGKDPGRVGHTFQTTTIAWTDHGVETLAAAAAGEAKIEGDEGFTSMFEKMAVLLSYTNEDALALSDTNCYENFANGQYAMCITGSYAKGTIQALNSDLRLGAFPLPNDTAESTKCAAGMDISICVSALASDEEKDAAYRFLEFLSQPESAQTFMSYDGAPSAIIGVASEDEGIAPITEILSSGRTHDWFASTISNNVIQDLNNVVQGFWADRDVDAVLKNMDASIAVTSVQ